MNNRPLSPHLSIYRWPITMVLSILHRATGIAMSIGLIVFAAWLLNAAQGPESYQYFRALMSGIVGQVLLIGWTFAFFLHLGNGVRHLFWDTGRGLEKQQANASAWFVLVFAAILTAAFWVLVL
ncbi:MAG: succinate dehydrogenase, cytochrome b556 subunit [Woeseiaceae bacterium]|nr:succinate dehydrogenase, cytochrome b556 subunit [Woeseiaceae bacterium]